MKRQLLLFGVVMACHATDGPQPVTGAVFVLESIAGQALPAEYAPSAYTGRAYADTLALHDDGTGERRMLHDGDTPGTRVMSVTTFTWLQAGSEITIAFTCPPGALCIAAPHLRGTRASGSFTVTESTINRVPLVYRYLFPPD